MTHFPWKRAIIVGASSGIGKELACYLAAAGCQVGIVARRAGELRSLADNLNTGNAAPLVRAYAHDTRHVDVTPALFDCIVQDLGGLDLIIYAAGIMPHISPSEYNTEKDKEIISVNLIGAVAWLNEAARRFEKMGTGTIVGISSVAGDRGRRGNTAYGASKAALNAYLESIRTRLERRGACVVTIKPGPIDTPMSAGLKVPGMVSAPYAAQLILAAARDKARVAYVPGKWRVIMAVVRAIPASIFKWLPL